MRLSATWVGREGAQSQLSEQVHEAKGHVTSFIFAALREGGGRQRRGGERDYIRTPVQPN